MDNQEKQYYCTERITLTLTPLESCLIDEIIEKVKIHHDKRISASAAIRISLNTTQGICLSPKIVEDMILSDRRRKKP